jgi:nucleotide-binding universal stress UspA family protein
MVPLSPDTTPDDLIVKAEYTEFLLRTRMDKLYPQADFSVSVPGRYRELEEQILVHRYHLVEKYGVDIPRDEAVINWVEEVYLPVIKEIRRRGILQNFPRRTETDLYVWLSRHRKRLESRLGWEVPVTKAAENLSEQFGRRAPQVVARVGERLYDAVTPDEFEPGPRPGRWREEHQGGRAEALFADFLVPISGEPSSWLALDQALHLAKAWNARLHGLHVVSEGEEVDSEATWLIKSNFDRRCKEAGIPGEIGIGVGKVARVICERARWVDLIILNMAHPPPSRPLAKIGSGFRTLIRRCSRPILAVPGPPSQFKRVLLSYDGSPKAEEALFVATYLADRWKIPLVVLSIVEPGRTSDGIITVAEDYMDTFGVEAEYIEARGPVPETILEICTKNDCDLIVMGGYGHRPVIEVVLGSAVDQVLRESAVPVLVCR